jgi:hypothetical protein
MNAPRIALALGAFLCGLAFYAPRARCQVFTSADLTAPLEGQGISARALALGSAYVAVPDDVSSYSFNPGALGTISSIQLGLHQQSWLDGFSEETLMASLPLKGLGVGGLSLSYLDFGTFAGRDINGDPSGSYGSHRLSATVGWGFPVFKDLFVGLSGRGVQQSISNQSFEAVAMDTGAVARLFSGFYAGASYINFGTYVDNFLLAARFQCGASYSFIPIPNHEALVCLDYSREPYNDAQFHFGLEDCLVEILAIRAGYQWDLYDNEVSGFHGLSAGLGLRWERMSLDYAYLPMGDLGTTQRISLQYDFGEKPVPSAKAKNIPSPSPTPSSSPTPDSTPSLSTTPAAASGSDNLKLYFMVPDESGAQASTPETSAEIKRLCAVIRENPKDARVWMDLGRLYYRIGRKEWAFQCFDEVLRLEPGTPGLQEWLDNHRTPGK